MTSFKVLFGGWEAVATDEGLTLSPEVLAELLEDTDRPEGYTKGVVPITVPLTSIKSLFREFSVEVLTDSEVLQLLKTGDVGPKPVRE